MTKTEILEWLESEIQGYPERVTGNECEDFIVRLAGDVVESERTKLAEAMRDWIVQRGRRTLLAIWIAEEYRLRELEPDIRCLLEDVKAGKAFSRYYEELIAPALKRIEGN